LFLAATLTATLVSALTAAPATALASALIAAPVATLAVTPTATFTVKPHLQLSHIHSAGATICNRPNVQRLQRQSPSHG
jgi:hypothetical protein